MSEKPFDLLPTAEFHTRNACNRFILSAIQRILSPISFPILRPDYRIFLLSLSLSGLLPTASGLIYVF